MAPTFCGRLSQSQCSTSLTPLSPLCFLPFKLRNWELCKAKEEKLHRKPKLFIVPRIASALPLSPLSLFILSLLVVLLALVLSIEQNSSRMQHRRTFWSLGISISSRILHMCEIVCQSYIWHVIYALHCESISLPACLPVCLFRHKCKVDKSHITKSAHAFIDFGHNIATTAREVFQLIAKIFVNFSQVCLLVLQWNK